MTIDQAAERVQFCYPQIYFACHTRHERKRSTVHRLSHRDSEILVHLDRAEPIRLTALAKHMGVAPSTLSEAVSALVALGYVAKAESAMTDRRVVALTLTAKGVAAVRASSVLEAGRLATVLKRMTPADRARAIDGLSLFADACRRR